jgi:hypothetical protein
MHYGYVLRSHFQIPPVVFFLGNALNSLKLVITFIFGEFLEAILSSLDFSLESSCPL